MIIVKRTSASEDWAVYHRSIGNASYLKLNDVQAAQGGTNTQWGQTTPTSSVFTLGGSDAMTNASGSSYVAYVFAHDAASFGTDGDESIIKCGSYTGSGSTDQTIDLGFEPQYILIKNTQVGQNWQEFDIMRGMISGNSLQFYPNLSHAEDSGTRIHPEANGFSFRDESSSRVNSSGNTFIYMAIRRPHKPPEVATEVFAMDTGNSSDTIPTFDSGFPVDFAIQTAYASTDDKFASARLIGAKYLKLNDKDAEANQTRAMFDSNVGWGTEWPSARLSWMFKRAPGFMDVVAYVGDNASNRAVPHNLEAVPELLIVKHRTGGTKDWHVYTQATGNQSDLRLNQNNSATTGFTYWASTTPTATHFYVSNVPAGDIVNQLDRNYIAILFATLPGISKVGSYTGTAATQNIDCGFTNGARFVLIKRTDGTGDWMLFDTTRGIVSGNDSNIWLNETDAAFASTDYIDPYSAGFTLTSENDTNGSSDEYIFLAIA